MRIIGIICLFSSLWISLSGPSEEIIEGEFLIEPIEVYMFMKDLVFIEKTDVNDTIGWKINSIQLLPYNNLDTIYGDTAYLIASQNEDLRPLRNKLIQASKEKITKCIDYNGKKRKVDYYKVRLKLAVQDKYRRSSIIKPNFCDKFRLRRKVPFESKDLNEEFIVSVIEVLD